MLGLVLLLVGALLDVPTAPPAAASTAAPDGLVAVDPAVAAARAAQQRAEADLAALTRALDDAAGAYERANAHALRLHGEITEADRQVEATKRAVRETEKSFVEQVVDSYKRPAADVELAQAVLAADRPGTAMHRVALLRQLHAGNAEHLAKARDIGVRTAEAAQQQHVVLAGSAGAAAKADRTAEALTALVEQARAKVDATREQTDAAEDQVRERVVADARRAAEDAAAQATWVPGPYELTGPGAGALAGAWLGAGGPVYCPVAGPVGFIDSWGYPRSGGRSHQGTDMFAAYGTPVVTPTDGTVRRVYTNTLGGLSIDFITAAGDRFYYAHLSAASVSAGQQLAAGSVLGAVGDSGNARGTPPHLHWQFHPEDGGPVNPYHLAAALCR